MENSYLDARTYNAINRQISKQKGKFNKNAKLKENKPSMKKSRFINENYTFDQDEY